jgi:hypothetical protein
MIRPLLYLTATRPDIQFFVCLCARFQASSRTSHWQAVKRIFRYLHHTPDFGLWYSVFSSLALHGFSDAEGPIRRTREGGSEWEPIKILLEGDENSNKMNTASNTRLRLTTQIGEPTQPLECH